MQLTDVVVVDNASDDSSTEIAKGTEGLPISVVQMTENAGYAAGINAGVTSLRDRPPDAVMVINPDCRFRPKTLDTLARALRAPGCGIVAPRLVNPNGSLQPTLRRLPTVRGPSPRRSSAADRRPAGARRAGVLGRTARRPGSGRLGDGRRPPDGLGHARVRRALGRELPALSEETEYMLRAADQGWSTWYEPAAVVEHKGGESGTRPSWPHS